MKKVESLRRVVSAYQADNGGRVAAAIAFKTMFAVAPALLRAVSVAGFVYGDGDVQRERSSARSKMWRFDSELESALNVVFRTQGAAGSGVAFFFKKRLAAVFVAVGMGVVLIAAMSVNLVSDMVAQWMDWPDAVAPALRWAGPTGSLLSLVGLFALVLRYVPQRKIPWSAALRGDGIAALGVVLASVVRLGRKPGLLTTLGRVIWLESGLKTEAATRSAFASVEEATQERGTKRRTLYVGSHSRA